MIDIKIVLVNKYGEFVGRKATLSEESYKGLLEMVKTFYVNGGFELTLEDDSFVVFPPEVVKESILKVVKIEE
jgi:hypothetical protein